jgi:hypothetical protein
MSSVQRKLSRLVLRRSRELSHEWTRGSAVGVLNLTRESAYVGVALPEQLLPSVRATLRRGDLTQSFQLLRSVNARLRVLKPMVYESAAHTVVDDLLRIRVRSRLDSRAVVLAKRVGNAGERTFQYQVAIDTLDAERAARRCFHSARIFFHVRDAEGRSNTGIALVCDEQERQTAATSATANAQKPLSELADFSELLAVPLRTRFGRLDITVVFRTKEENQSSDAVAAELMRAGVSAVQLSDAATQRRLVTRAQHSNWIINDATAVERAVDEPTAIDRALRQSGIVLNDGEIAATCSVVLCASPRPVTNAMFYDARMSRAWPNKPPMHTGKPRSETFWQALWK